MLRRFFFWAENSRRWFLFFRERRPSPGLPGKEIAGWLTGAFTVRIFDPGWCIAIEHSAASAYNGGSDSDNKDRDDSRWRRPGDTCSSNGTQGAFIPAVRCRGIFLPDAGYLPIIPRPKGLPVLDGKVRIAGQTVLAPFRSGSVRSDVDREEIPWISAGRSMLSAGTPPIRSQPVSEEWRNGTPSRSRPHILGKVYFNEKTG